MTKQIHIQTIADDLRAHADEIAERAYEMGYRKERRGEWLLDTGYTGKAKEIYICSVCNHWHAIKKKPTPDKLRHMIYCPYCGARMSVPEEDKQ